MDSPAGLAVRLAQAITRPHGRALLLTASNGADRWTSIEAAVASGRAFAVELRRDVVALDGDRDDAEGATKLMAGLLHARGLTPLVVPSGQPGRRHLFCRVPNPELRRRLASQARQLGLDVRRSIRPPWSPHRLGLNVTRPAQAELETAIVALGPRRPYGQLSAATRRRLRLGDPRAASRSECDWSVALGFVHAGHDESDLWRAFTDPDNVAGAKVRQLLERRGLGEARRYVRLRHQRATAYAAAHPPIATPTDARVEILAIRAAIDEMPWPGATGDTDRAVLEAELTLRLELGRLTISASEREIAERAGMARPAVRAARRRLQEKGLLKPIPTSRRHTHALTWKLYPPPATSSHANLLSPSGGRQGMGRACTFDVWRHGRAGGLGKGCWRVWRQLDDQDPRRAAALASELGVHPSTVRRRLTRLSHAGLARRVDGAWVPVERDLAEVARELGADQAAARQRERHDQERDTWEQQIADRRARHLADEAERYLADLDDEEREAATTTVGGRQVAVPEDGEMIDRPWVAQPVLGGHARPAEPLPPSVHPARQSRGRPDASGRMGLNDLPADPEMARALAQVMAAFGPVRLLRLQGAHGIPGAPARREPHGPRA